MVKTLFKDNASNKSTQRAKNILILINKGYKVSAHANVAGTLQIKQLSDSKWLAVYGVNFGDRANKLKPISLFKLYGSLAEGEAEVQSFTSKLQAFNRQFG